MAINHRLAYLLIAAAAVTISVGVGSALIDVSTATADSSPMAQTTVHLRESDKETKAPCTADETTNWHIASLKLELGTPGVPLQMKFQDFSELVVQHPSSVQERRQDYYRGFGDPDTLLDAWVVLPGAQPDATLILVGVQCLAPNPPTTTTTTTTTTNPPTPTTTTSTTVVPTTTTTSTTVVPTTTTTSTTVVPTTTTEPPTPTTTTTVDKGPAPKAIPEGDIRPPGDQPSKLLFWPTLGLVTLGIAIGVGIIGGGIAIYYRWYRPKHPVKQ